MFKVQLLNKTPWVQLLDAVVHYLPQEFTIKFTLKLMASSWTLKIQMSTLLTAIMKIFDLNVLNTVLCLKNTTMMVHRRNIMRADKFVPQYMRVSDQASHSICSICTCNHEDVVFYNTPSLVIFCYCPSKIFSCAGCIQLKPFQLVNQLWWFQEL